MLKTLKKIQPIYYMISIFLLCLLYSILSNDRLPFKYADIFDEKYYIAMIENFSKLFSEQRFNPYYISRLFIPGIAHVIFNFFNIAYTLNNIQTVLLIFNLFAIAISMFYYYKIVKIKQYNSTISILGFCFIFINFFILKFSNYYPIIMDVFGFTSGILLYYYYIVQNKIIFFSILFISMFVFPTTSLIILAFAVSAIIKFNDDGFSIKKYLNFYLYPLFLLCILFELYYLYSNYNLFLITTKKDLPVQSLISLIPLTFLIFNCFIFFLLKYILILFDNISLQVKGIKSSLFIISILIFIVFFFIKEVLTTHFKDKEILTSENFLFNLIFQAFSYPLKFLVTHFIYYGLFVCFLLYFHKRFFYHTAKKSDSFIKIIILIFSIFFVLGTETRQFLQFFPFIVFTFLNSLRKIRFNNYQLSCIFIFQLFWSRFWYIINTPEGFLNKALQEKNLFNFPAQKYFQFQGPWLSTNNTIIYSLIFILTFIIFGNILKVKSINKFNP